MHGGKNDAHLNCGKWCLECVRLEKPVTLEDSLFWASCLFTYYTQDIQRLCWILWVLNLEKYTLLCFSPNVTAVFLYVLTNENRFLPLKVQWWPPTVKMEDTLFMTVTRSKMQPSTEWCTLMAATQNRCDAGHIITQRCIHVWLGHICCLYFVIFGIYMHICLNIQAGHDKTEESNKKRWV